MASLVANIMGRAAAAFGYDATEDRGRRRVIRGQIKHEDQVADSRKRKILSATTADLQRNFAIAAWAIRCHLTYVSSFQFQARTPDRGYNKYLEEHWARVTGRGAFDAASRHPYRRALRLTEARRVVDGDCFWMKLGSGKYRGQVQMLEADRIALDRQNMPENMRDPERWCNGVFCDDVGAALAFAVCDRNRSGSGLKLRRVVPARNMLQHAFFDRLDQVRGISPISSALNWFRDTYEGFEYALAKVKIAQLFGIAFQRDSESNPFGEGAAAPTFDRDGDGEEESDYEVTLPQGMFSLDLNTGETANILEAKTPAAETVEFLKLMVHVALRSLDIPYSFFDESFTNFYGSRGGLIQYLKACKDKRQDLVEFQDEYTRWRLGLDVVDGLLELPAGKDFDFIRWQHIPDGVPWWDPTKEVRGHAMSIAAGFSSPQQVCAEVGTDFEENVDQIAEAMEYAREKGVPITFADSSAFAPEINVTAEAAA